MTFKSAVTPLLPLTLQDDLHYASGVRAGRWIFATGHKATEPVVDPAAPRFYAVIWRLACPLSIQGGPALL